MRLDDIVHCLLALRPLIWNALHESLCGGKFMQSVTVPLHIAQCTFNQVISIDFNVCSSCPRTVCWGVCPLSAISGLRDGLISFSIFIGFNRRRKIVAQASKTHKILQNAWSEMLSPFEGPYLYFQWSNHTWDGQTIPFKACGLIKPRWPCHHMCKRFGLVKPRWPCHLTCLRFGLVKPQ